jgi:hypothetical protein
MKIKTEIDLLLQIGINLAQSLTLQEQNDNFPFAYV